MASTESEVQVQNKRPAENDSEQSEVKKSKTDLKTTEDGSPMPYRKKKASLLMMFCGNNYTGMQRNPNVTTIEGCLMEALLKAGLVTQDHVDDPRNKMEFMRASRTDKKVSAAGMVCSLKMFSEIENSVEKINEHLPADIRVLEAIWMTKNFNCMKWSDSRTYSYMMPTFAFVHHTQEPSEDYRVTDAVLSRANEILQLFVGTHNFYNYTSGRGPTDRSCNRYITEFATGKPFERDGMEYVTIIVKGQSFMLHQIRKMIGTMIAIVQELITTEYIEQSFGPERMDIPKAPGVGLMLEEIHFYNYNKKYGDDGIHKPIDFSKHRDAIEQFKRDFIHPVMIEEETKEKSMLNWIESLRRNHFQGQIPLPGGEDSAKTDSVDSSNSEENNSTAVKNGSEESDSIKSDSTEQESMEVTKDSNGTEGKPPPSDQIVKG